MEPLPQDPLKVRIKAYEVIMKFLQYQLEYGLLTDKFPIEVACECMENLQNLLNGKQAAAEAISPPSNLLPTFEMPNQQTVLAEARLEAYDAIINFLKSFSSNLSSTCTETFEIARNSMQAIQEIILQKNIDCLEVSSSGKSSSDRLTANSQRSDSYYGIAGKRSNSLDSLLGIGEMPIQPVLVPVLKDAKSSNGQSATDQETEKRKFSLFRIEDEPEASHVATLSPRKRSLSTNDLNIIGELQSSPPKQRKQHAEQEYVLVEGNMKGKNLVTMEDLSRCLVNLQLKNEDNEIEKNVSQNTNKDGPSTKPA